MEGIMGFMELHKGWKKSKTFNGVSKGMEWIYDTQLNGRNKRDSINTKEPMEYHWYWCSIKELMEYQWKEW